MSAKEDRAERREAKLRAMKARIEALSLEFQAEFDRLLGCLKAYPSAWNRERTMEQIVDLLKRVDAADVPLWSFEKRLEGVVADNKYAAEDYGAFLGMIAQIVNPRLAGRTPGTVHARYRETNFARRYPKKVGVHQ